MGPKTWVDAQTGHRVTRLSDQLNSETLYFNVNAFTPDGLDMIYVAPRGLYALNPATFKSTLLVASKVDDVVLGTKTRRVFFRRHGDIHISVVDIDSKQVTQVATMPLRGEISSVNADETMLVGTVVEGTAPTFKEYYVRAMQESGSPSLEALQAANAQLNASTPNSGAPKQTLQTTTADAKTPEQIINGWNAKAMEMRYAAHTPEDMFTVNIASGAVNVILKGTDWLNHAEFSPTDPTLILYDHDGLSTEVDRVWTIRSDGSQNEMLTKRGEHGIVTHEFWSHDGKTVWFDLQEAKGEQFAIAGIDVATGGRTKYTLGKQEAAVHYNISFDGQAFCGDGNVPAHGEIGVHGHRTLNRKWIELLRPAPDGTLHSTRLAAIPDQNYLRAEPNARFSPDKKLVIFTSNTYGPNFVYAVEVDKATDLKTAAAQTTAP